MTWNTLLTFIKDNLAFLTAIFSGTWVALTFLWNQRLAIQARHLEARKPFLEKQLSLYFETAVVNGRLASLRPGDSSWAENEARFWQLYWSELSLVESRAVEATMVAAGRALMGYKKDPDKESLERAFKDAVYQVAHAIRDSIALNWGHKQTKSALGLVHDLFPFIGKFAPP